MRMASGTGLHNTSGIDEFVRVINEQNEKLNHLNQEIHLLKTSQGLPGGIGGEAREPTRRNLTDLKGITMLETFDGTEKHFKDWYTKLRNFVQYNLHFELFLKKIMEMDNEPVYEVIRDLADNEKK